jgi:hypothetical protein
MPVARNRVISAYLLMALLVTATTAEMNLCRVNCALAGLSGPQHEQMHHSSAAVRSEAHHHHHMDLNSNALPAQPALHSRQCAKYAESTVLSASSKFVVTRNIELSQNSAINTSVSAGTISASSVSFFPVSPPIIAAHTQTPIRI